MDPQKPTHEWCVQHERHERVPACEVDPLMYVCFDRISYENDQAELATKFGNQDQVRREAIEELTELLDWEGES